MKPVQTPQSDVNLTLRGGTDENDLPAQRVLVYDTQLGETQEDAKLAFESLWMPDDEEARKLEAGAAVVLRVWAIRNANGDHTMPPVSVSVSDAVLPERELMARATIDTAIGKLFADLKERAARVVQQIVDEDVLPDQLVDTGGEPNVEAIGFPDPATFSEMWIAALQAAQGVPTAAQNGGLISNGGDDVTTSQKLDAETMNAALEATGSDVRVSEPNASDGTPERRACLAAGGHFWSGFDEEQERSMPCERCGYNPGWIPSDEPKDGSDGSVAIARANDVSVRGNDRRKWRYRCASCLATWIGKRKEPMTRGR